jgi:hypothetical protein
MKKGTNTIRNFLIIFALLICIRALGTYNPVKRTYHTNLLKGTPPEINGNLNDSSWNSVTWQKNFIQQKPVEGAAPSKETLIKVMYDENSIYAAIFCYDTPDNIRRIFTKRDQFGGDIVGLAFDSFNNQRTAYEFNLTAAGQKIDLMHTGDGNIDFNWDANWEGVTGLTDSGWVAEFRIPFSQLRYNKQEEHTWGFFAWRFIDRNKEEAQWVLLPVNGPHGVHNFGQIDGISNIRTSRQTEFLPYVSGKYEYSGRKENPYIGYNNIVPNAGVDMKVGISSNFTLDATINPDFGQVEADPAQLNLSAFEIFFEERRPFFLEGRDIFNFSIGGNQLFYSRRLGASANYQPDTEDGEYFESPDNTTILGSGKITGRTSNGWSVGLLETVTNNEYGMRYSPFDSIASAGSHAKERILVEPMTSYFASRIKKESEDANTIVGGSFNSVIRNLNDPVLEQEFIHSAHTAGIDLIQYFNDKDYYIMVSGMMSHLKGSEAAISKKQESHIHRFQRPDAKHLEFDSTRTTLTGTSGFFELGKNSGKFRFETNISYFSPELNINDIGFMAETDFYEQENEISFHHTEPGRFIREYHIELENNNRFTFGNEKTNTELLLQSNATFTNLWSIFLEYQHVFSSFDVRSLRGGPALYRDGYQGGGSWLQTNTSKRLFFEVYSFYFFKQLNQSYHHSIGGSINYDPLDKLKLQLITHWEKNNFANEFFDADLSEQNIYMIGRLNQQTLQFTLRAEYYFKPEISFQYYGNPFFSAVNYTDIRRTNNSRAEDPETRFYWLERNNELVLDEEANRYYVNEANGTQYDFENPDVMVGVFQSNFVFRWEYKLGSFFYLVWSHNQNEYSNINSPYLINPINRLFSVPSGDALMIKFSYWFNI